MQFYLVQARGYNKYCFPWKLAMQYLKGSQLVLLRRIRYLIYNLIKSQNIISFSLPGHQGYPSSLPHTSVPTEMSESDRAKVFIGSTMPPLLGRLDCFTFVSIFMQFFNLLTYVYGLLKRVMEFYFDISASKTRRCVDVKAAAKQLIFLNGCQVVLI